MHLLRASKDKRLSVSVWSCSIITNNACSWNEHDSVNVVELEQHNDCFHTS